MAFIDLFVERKEKKPPPKKVTSPMENVPSNVYVPPASSGSVTEYTEHFKQILKEENTRNFPGNDFYEFYLMKEGMNALPDEKQRYVIAFNGLAAAGLTREKLLSTAEKYKEIVEREVNDFTTSYNQTYSEQVTTLEKKMQDKTKEMSELYSKINSLQSEVASLKQESMENAQKLSDKKNGFLMAGNAQKQEILTEIEKINEYIL